MWPYTEEENNYLSNPKDDWDYDTYGHGA